jgi:hypothetical protein
MISRTRLRDSGEAEIERDAGTENRVNPLKISRDNGVSEFERITKTPFEVKAVMVCANLFWSLIPNPAL